LDAKVKYTIKNLDREICSEATGKELMMNGLLVVMKDRPGAVVITYNRSVAAVELHKRGNGSLAERR
jgi:hypothetical protein